MHSQKTLLERAAYLAFYTEITLLELWLALSGFLEGLKLSDYSTPISASILSTNPGLSLFLPFAQILGALLLGYCSVLNIGRRTHWFLLLTFFAAGTWALELFIASKLTAVPLLHLGEMSFLAAVVFVRSVCRTGHSSFLKKEKIERYSLVR